MIANPADRGLPAANNQGIDATAGRYVLISHADVEYRPGAIAALIDALDRRPRAAIAVPQLVHLASGSARRAPGTCPRCVKRCSGRSAGGTPRAIGCAVGLTARSRAIGYGAQAALSRGRAAIDAVGRLDVRYPPHWEGVEWSARMSDGGWESGSCPARSSITLPARASSRRRRAALDPALARGMYQYFSSRRPAWQRPNLATAIAARAMMKAGAIKAGARIYDRAERNKAVSHDAVDS